MNVLRLYPRRWRARYEDEMLAVLEEHGVSLRTRINLLRGALDAHLTMRRNPMVGNRRPTFLWIVGLALIPTTIMVAKFLTFMFGLAGHNTIQALGDSGFVIGVVAWAAVCSWSGVRTRGVGGVKRDAAIAGGVTGVIAWVMAWLVGWLLDVAGLAGLYGWAVGFAGGRGSFYVPPSAISTSVHGILDPRMMWPLAVIALASALGGAALGIAGWIISEFRVVRNPAVSANSAG